MLSNATKLREISPAEAGSLPLLKERLVALQSTLSKNAVESEQNRRAHEENIQAIAEAGAFKLMVPKRFGGMESTIRAHLEVTGILAEGCGGTAWVTALTNVCAWLSGLYCEQAQNDVFGQNPEARVAGVFAPSSTTLRVSGGLRVSGKWYSSSGILHAHWAMVGVLELNEQKQVVGHYMALIPKDDFSIDDTWFTSGMRASGSNCIVASDVFVPDHRLLNMRAALSSDYATEFSSETAYQKPLMPIAALILVGAQLGLGRAALKHVLGKAHQRGIAYTNYGRQSDSVIFQAQVADAAIKLHTAELLALSAADEIDACGADLRKMEYVDRARIRAITGEVAKTVTDAIDILVSAHGAGTFAESNPLQRYWRDANAAARHAIVLPAVGKEVFGEALLGLESKVTNLV
ncbi:acyl-CoA dehydrogenase family protein [Pseudomonas sp. D8002]|uniref:acyl-CoA dehydrogenase family protein n=1 Tax=unclassified Pseudomonas TaxID=196821 RepID=UPI0015A03762|nr:MULTISPECIES: acyl-CoA dehydrogenase family protein [unclassified Pseudomonas]NWA91483.1 acyl-CoA dehydrogenase family protein [Pseudomonas sp. D8002]NWB21056.1 acyl-CoA dehydrogenase family protein [Pseudomonas sp. D4002]